MLTLEKISLVHEQNFILREISLQLNPREAILITGPSGSGKTLLGKVIAGILTPSAGKRTTEAGLQVVFVGQQHTFNPTASEKSYYQQRYDSNYGILYPTVEQFIAKDFPDNTEAIVTLLKKFSLEYILSRQLIQLSNGEGKRLHLILALVKAPKLLVLDNPLIGVDVQSRKFLMEMLDHLSGEGIAYVIIASSVAELPGSVSKVISLAKGQEVSEEKPESWRQKQLHEAKDLTENLAWEKIDEFLFDKEDAKFDTAIGMKNVSVTFGESRVLDHVDWEVKRGERWLIRGANGSGKSMLLSLINGDNPKAFGQHIVLFDKLKGSGESIWELKARIGFVSPEMHLHFLRRPDHFSEIVAKKNTLEDPYTPPTTAHEVVLSGFFDLMGFGGQNTSLQIKIADRWLEFLRLDQEAKTPFYQLPLGQQRLLLLARALVKNPPLLILDEPCQGLDDEQTAVFKKMVDRLCLRFNKTLLYVSHYDQDVPECVSKLLELEKGKIVSSSNF